MLWGGKGEEINVRQENEFIASGSIISFPRSTKSDISHDLSFHSIFHFAAARLHAAEFRVGWQQSQYLKY
jgi:hypothetical protein